MKIGYARVSTNDQTTAMQLDALNKAGCEEVFTDEGYSGASKVRPALEKCMARLQPGDCLVVYKLDRLGRSLSYVISLMDDLARKGVAFQSITEGFDTKTPAGKMIFHVIGALAEFERELIKERVTCGVRAAQARGVHCGRKTKLDHREIKDMLYAGHRAQDLAKRFGVSRATIYNLARHKEA